MTRGMLWLHSSCRLIILFLLTIKAEEKNFYGNRQITNTIGGDLDGYVFRFVDFKMKENHAAMPLGRIFFDDSKVKKVHYGGVTTEEEFKKHFKLERNGWLSSLAPLDREKQDQWDIWVEPQSRYKFLMVVKVYVTDQNDHVPRWIEIDNYLFALPQDTPVRTTWKFGYAEDLDVDFYGLQKYELTAKNDNSGTFGVTTKYNKGRLTCYLVLQKPLNAKEKRHYVMTISAVDGGRPPLAGETTVYVAVLDESDDLKRGAANAMLPFQLSQIAIASLLWKYVVV